MARTIVTAEERLDALLSPEILNRVAQTLWQWIQPYADTDGSGVEGEAEAGGGSRDSNAPRIPLTNEELAALVGTSPQTISACLGKLKEYGILERRRGWIVLLRAELLRALVEAERP